MQKTKFYKTISLKNSFYSTLIFHFGTPAHFSHTYTLTLSSLQFKSFFFNSLFIYSSVFGAATDVRKHGKGRRGVAVV